MTERLVAFVRNVMIGREGLHAGVLLELFANAGARAPRSYISTGNVTFLAASRGIDAVVRRVERGLEDVIGRREEVYVRTISHLQQMVSADPFAESPFAEAVDKTVSFTLLPIDETSFSLPILSGREDVALFAIGACEVYGVSRMVDGRTNAPGGLVERTLGQRVTSRSWNTVLRIAADSE